ncbi:MAG: calcium/sodium antiporter [Flavobacteriaceae bacterium]|jgi:cation:H+ antiporter|nr:calcium/sodium antiporter [Flavobacteriaceae bacterium]
MTQILLLLGGLALLIFGGNALLKSSVSISLKLSIPKIIVGMTVVSFATSLPELVVSLNAALAGNPDLALGNVVGSNAANIGLVLGVTLLFGSMEVTSSFYKIDWPALMVASLLLLGFLYFDGVLSRFEGGVLVLVMIAFLWWLLKMQSGPAVVDELPSDDELLSIPMTFGYLVAGGVGLWLGSEWLVEGAVSIAEDIGVSDRVIGITVVSIGTSIPELAASIIAIIKKEKAISLGNLIGSNIFNIMSVLGITAIVSPITVKDQGFITNDLFFMTFIAFVLFPLVFAPSRMKLSWKEGLVLLSIYGAFVYKVIL